MIVIFALGLIVLFLIMTERANAVQRNKVIARANRYLGTYSLRNQKQLAKSNRGVRLWSDKLRRYLLPLPSVAALAVTYFVSGATHIILGLLLGAGAFLLTSKLYLSREAQKRLENIEHELPQAIDVFARAISAGVPVERAILSVKHAFNSPLGDEFERIHDALILGVPFQQALTDASRRVESGGFQYFTAILSLNAETGGPLVEVLNNLSVGLREKQKLDKKVMVLTAEPRMAARVVTGIPIALLTLQFVKQPEQIDFLLNDPTGQQVMLYALTSIVIGLFVIQRLTKIG
ncbi:type II secretion system F family protein [Vibrio amylolyticus]|uniref:type II secretion system F family protein n=1 Tax=Vibrio amylolyticus TaxID=2847292 RepID=UPI0035508A12